MTASRIRIHARNLALVGMSFIALATQAQQAPVGQDQPSNRPQGEHRKPPPEALAACKSLASGAACNFTSPRGAEAGTCGAPEGKPLACRPAHAGGQRGQSNQQLPKR